MSLKRVLDDISLERIRQDSLWGVQNHNASFWMSILGEEIGESHTAILEMDLENLREELVQSAAVLVAMVECIDRQGENFRG